MSDADTHRDHLSSVRDYASLVDRVFARGPERVCDELSESVPETADPASEPALLRRLLRTNAHLLTRSRDRTEVACTLSDVLAREPRVSAWLTGMDEALPPVRLAARGPDTVPTDARLLRVLTGHRAPVCSVAWSPDGGKLATVGLYDATVRIWDTGTWRQEQRLDIEGASLDRAAWSPDGRRLAVLGRSDRFPDLGEYDADDVHGWESRTEYVRTVLVYDTATWKEQAATPTAPRSGYGAHPAIAWSPDSRTLAIGEDIGVRLWAVDEGERSPWLLVGDVITRVLDLHWHSDGALAALAQGGGPVPGGNPPVPESLLLTWSDPCDDPRYRVWGHGTPWDSVSGVRWHPDGERVCVFSRRELVVCAPGSERVLWRTEREHGAPWTRAVEWSPDGGVLAELRLQHQGWAHLVLWDVRVDGALSPRARIDCCPEETTALAWSPDGGALTTGGSGGVRLWTPLGGGHHTPERRVPRCADPVWSPDGARVAVRSFQGGPWYTADARDPRRTEPAGDRCPFPHTDVEETRDLVEAARREGRDYDSYASMHGRYAPDAVSPGRELYALAGGLAPVRLFDLVNGGSRRLNDTTPEGRWTLVRFSPDADGIVTVQHRTVSYGRGGDWVEEIVFTLWDVTTGEQLARTRSRGSRSGRAWADYPRDLVVGRAHLAWCGNHGVVALHDARTLEPLSRTRVTGEVNGVAFSPDERALAVTGDAGVRVFDVVDGGLLG
ncbi:WD40 repeat domain-containing protein [Nocardiopsis sp. FIRDI 009]|uniref:WD40 repeat domain-containing protein n=1 Tax=Nocardiopsis sp. FIRDI 009 TaxID=714197 RepID=UPI000E25795B|nr:WD40 repeat domain-containing protein [Nocardiopsis sp. FIRDI 009]